MPSFPYGKAAFSLLILSLVCGLWLAFTPPPHRTATLTFWTFAQTHYDAYIEAKKSFEAAHPGVTVDIQLVVGNGLASRLSAAMQADVDVPDLCEIEISTAGTFFRGPVEHVGFLDLTERIHRSGLWERMVQARFAPYTYREHIFGLPHDVHPVMLAYNRELMEKLGVDVRQIRTWDDFVRIGRKITIPSKRYMIEFSDSGRDNIETCLFQRGGGYFDPQGKCLLDNEASVQTMLWYVPLVAGEGKIGNNIGGGQILTNAVEKEYFVCLVAPDWRTKSIEKVIPRMEKKMALMPFPSVTPGGPRTSTWGGTMLGITKRCANPDLAWEFALHLYQDKKELGERFRGTNIIPALRDAWNEPAFDEPRPYWSNQPLGAYYAELAPEVPYQYTSPFIETAKSKLGEALVACVARYNAQGANGFEPFVRDRLKQAAEQVRRLTARNPY